MTSNRVDPETMSLYRGLDNLPSEFWTDLAEARPEQVAFRAGVRYEPESGYFLPFLGSEYRIDPIRRTIETDPPTPRPGFQVGLVLLNYLLHASEAGLDGRMVTERELNGGALFFQGPHALSKDPILKKFARAGREFLDRGLRFGGSPLPDGDAAFRLLILPKILIAYTLYEADDEFPAGLVITFDRNADRRLPLDGLWAMINVATHRLAEGPVPG